MHAFEGLRRCEEKALVLYLSGVSCFLTFFAMYRQVNVIVVVVTFENVSQVFCLAGDVFGGDDDRIQVIKF